MKYLFKNKPIKNRDVEAGYDGVWWEVYVQLREVDLRVRKKTEYY